MASAFLLEIARFVPLVPLSLLGAEGKAVEDVSVVGKQEGGVCGD